MERNGIKSHFYERNFTFTSEKPKNKHEIRHYNSDCHYHYFYYQWYGAHTPNKYGSIWFFKTLHTKNNRKNRLLKTNKNNVLTLIEIILYLQMGVGERSLWRTYPDESFKNKANEGMEKPEKPSVINQEVFFRLLHSFCQL